MAHSKIHDPEAFAYENGTHPDYLDSLWLNVGNEFGTIDPDSVAEYLNRHGYREV